MGTEPVAITGYTYDELMLKHECPWAKDHQEGPRRLSSILDRCRELFIESISFDFYFSTILFCFFLFSQQKLMIVIFYYIIMKIS